MRFRNIFITLILSLTFFMPFSYGEWQKAEAQLELGINAEQVHIVADTAETTIKNTLNTALIEARTALSGMRLDDIDIKEQVLDPIAWNMAKQLQQQLTGNLLKWIGGQLPGQNGQVPFVQNYSAHYQNVMDQVVGEYLFTDKGGATTSQCGEERTNRVLTTAYNSYMSDRQDSQKGGALQCSQEELGDYESAGDKILGDFLECRDELCAYYATQKELALRTANAVENERQLLNLTRGMKAQRVCRGEGGSSSSTVCELVNPPYLAADAASFQLVELPGLQMLQTDEFNEVLSNLMSNLTNQALTGLTGILGLTGNPTYSANVFGDNGNLSYVDALVADDISRYQTATVNPIKTALEAAVEYKTMLDKILADIKDLEDKLAADTAEFRPCFDLTLTTDLTGAKATASSSLAIASTSIAILSTLDLQHASSTSASARGAIMSTFIVYKNQGLFRSEYDNQQFKTTYLDYTFAQWVDKFKYDIAVERQSCGGSWDYIGVLTLPTSTSTPPREGP